MTDWAALRRGNESKVPASRLRELFAYNPAIGVLTRRVAVARAAAGSVAGFLHTKSGYWRVGVDRQSFAVHRVIWCMVHGAWPTNYVDHINGNRSDNRLDNLREATHAQNIWNSKAQRNSHQHLKGTTQLPSGNWQAQIRHQGRQVHIGTFATAELAHAAYVAKARELFGEFARVA